MTYKEVLQGLADKASEEYVNNSTIEHAVAMIEQLLRIAKGKVLIMTGYFDPAVYDRPEIREATRRFLLNSGNEIRAILISEQAAEDNPFVRFLREQKRASLFLDKCGSLKNCNHFMLVETATGNYAFRMQTDNSSHCATGSFNAGRDGERLRDFFDRCCTSKFVRLLI